MENKADSTWITEDRFPNGKIILLDGRVLDCYSRMMNEQAPYTDKERKEEDVERFIKNAFFFLAHKERILTDSRMFLCAVPITSGMSISGTSGFENPTLGIYLQWWEVCAGAMFTDKKGRRGLLYKLSGSSLSGHNICGVVHEDGTTKNVELRLPLKTIGIPSSVLTTHTSLPSRNIRLTRSNRCLTSSDLNFSRSSSASFMRLVMSLTCRS